MVVVIVVVAVVVVECWDELLRQSNFERRRALVDQYKKYDCSSSKKVK